jgi:hypothetical protein
VSFAKEPTQAPGQPASGGTVGMDPADVERWRALAALLGTAHLVSGVLPSAWVDLLFGRVSDERQCVWCPSLASSLVQLLRTQKHRHRSPACTFTPTCTLTCCTLGAHAHLHMPTRAPSPAPLHICMRGAARQVVTEPVGSVLRDCHLAPCACLSSALMLSFSCFGSDGMDHPFNRKVRD